MRVDHTFGYNSTYVEEDVNTFRFGITNILNFYQLAHFEVRENRHSVFYILLMLYTLLNGTKMSLEYVEINYMKSIKFTKAKMSQIKVTR